MTKQRKRPPKRAENTKTSPTAKRSETSNATDRRDFLGRLRNGAMVAVAVGGVGWYVVSEVRAGIEEADLTKIGNGMPTIVQIHDPQCPTCQALQRETRKALDQFDEGDLQYLVANIRQDKGKRFASKHGVPHVTLLLFDGAGEHRDTLSGPNSADNLERAFRRHLERQTQS